MKFPHSLLVSLAFVVGSCSLNDDEPMVRITSLTDDFNKSINGWDHGFSDFPAGKDSTSFDLKFEYTTVPGLSKKALMLSGNNESDDLFMYLKRQMSQLEPNTQYTITFDVEFASEAKVGLDSNGNSPGESVFLKVGATNFEPKTVIEDDNYVMNLDKGNQGQGGANMMVIGDISVPQTSSGFVVQNRTNSPYTNNSYENPVLATTNSNGELWFIVGTDSSFKGTTTIYYTKISVVLSRVK